MNDDMESDLYLWDAISTPPSTANEFSREAAESVLGSAGTLRRRVAAYVRDHEEVYGVAVEEWGIEDGLDLHGNTVRPRLWELQRHGIIELDPEPGVTPSGRRCGRYRCTALGRKLLAL